MSGANEVDGKNCQRRFYCSSMKNFTNNSLAFSKPSSLKTTDLALPLGSEIDLTRDFPAIEVES
jgi:hypothetical protein